MHTHTIFSQYGIYFVYICQSYCMLPFFQSNKKHCIELIIDCGQTSCCCLQTEIKQENLCSIYMYTQAYIYIYIDVHTRRLNCKQVQNEDHLQFNINLPTSVVSSTDYKYSINSFLPMTAF